MSESLHLRDELPDPPRELPRLSAEAIALLHTALESEVGTRGPTSSGAVKQALGCIAVEAKRDNRQPEWLLVALKAAAYSVPALQHVPRGPDRDAVVARLVSLCIDEYYSGSPLGADSPARSGSPTVEK